MTDDIWFIEKFDAYVAENADGATLEKSREAVAQEYATAVELGLIERWTDGLVDEGRRLFDHIVKPTRDRRRQSMRKSMEYMLSAIHGETVLGEDDPILSNAYPLGTADGTDKSLRYWTVDNWRYATTERYRGAAKATSAAAEFDEDASQIIAVMESSGALTTGDLFAKALA